MTRKKPSRILLPRNVARQAQARQVAATKLIAKKQLEQAAKKTKTLGPRSVAASPRSVVSPGSRTSVATSPASNTTTNDEDYETNTGTPRSSHSSRSTPRSSSSSSRSTPRSIHSSPRTVYYTPSSRTPLSPIPESNVPLDIVNTFHLVLDGKKYDARTLAKSFKNAARSRAKTKNPKIIWENFGRVPHTSRRLTRQEGQAILEMTGRTSDGNTIRVVRKRLGELKPKYTMSKPAKNKFDTAETSANIKNMICQGKPFDLSNPPPCFVDDLKKTVDEEFVRKKAIANAGDTVCGKPALSPHQRVVFDIARSLFYNGMEKMSGHRGLICYHSVGSGKTALALCILIAAMTSGKQYKVVIVTTPSNKQNNSIPEYASNLYTFFPQYLKLFGLTPPRDSADVKGWSKRDDVVKAIEKHLHIESFTATTWRSGGFKPNTVLIMDESQNLIVQNGKLQQYTEQAKEFRTELLKAQTMKNTYVFALSATPSAGSIGGFVTTANIVRPLGRPLFTENDPPSAYKGIVSYVELREDRSMFGQLGTWTGSKIVPLQGPFHSRVQNQYFEMGNKYYMAFLKKLSDESNTVFDPQKPDDFFKILTKRASILTATECTPYIKIQEAIQAKRGVTVGNSKFLLSNKLMAALKNITTMPGKQFIFAANDAIAKAIEGGLQQIYGYKRVTIKEIDAEIKGDLKDDWVPKLIKAGAKDPKRYMAYGTGVRYSPNETLEPKHIWGMKQLMSHDANLHGEYCKIMVATGNNYEGLDIKAWRGVHIVQQLVTKDRDEQALGRALRACGHSKLPPSERTAVIIRYFSTPPKNFDPEAAAAGLKGKAADTDFVQDAIQELKEMSKGSMSPNVMVFSDAVARQEKLSQFERCIRQQAIDCPFLRSGLEYDHPCGGECKVSSSTPRPSLPTLQDIKAAGILGGKMKKPVTSKRSPSSSKRSPSSSKRSPSSRRSPKQTTWTTLFGGAAPRKRSPTTKIPARYLQPTPLFTSPLVTKQSPVVTRQSPVITRQSPVITRQSPSSSRSSVSWSPSMTMSSLRQTPASWTKSSPISMKTTSKIPQVSNNAYSKRLQKYFVTNNKKRSWWPFR